MAGRGWDNCMICAHDESCADASLGHACLDSSQHCKESSTALQLPNHFPGRWAEPVGSGVPDFRCFSWFAQELPIPQTVILVYSFLHF